MSDTPLYQQTLSDLLQAGRSGVERAQAKAAEKQFRAEHAVPQDRVRSDSLAGPAEPEVEPEVPPVPSMSELMTPTPGVTRFLDALLGPSDA
ncbi:MAG: hypothetical protein ABR549_14980 [Mycobacteriales bacterium]